MFCPSCGAENTGSGARYCRECGAALPVEAQGREALATRPEQRPVRMSRGERGSRALATIQENPKNGLLAGAAGVVVVVVALWVVIHVIIATLMAIVIPAIVVAALGAIAYVYLRGLRRR
jgi:Flp pilus assembly protein TadB